MDFTSGGKDDAAKLETILNNILFNKEITFSYDGWILEDGIHKHNKIESPVHMLPMKNRKGVAFASFKINGDLFEWPIGFYNEAFDSSTNSYIKYYTFDKNSRLSMDHWALDTTLYLPLALTQLFIKFPSSEKAAEQKPYGIYGIKSDKGLHPLVVVEECGDKFIFSGLCDYLSPGLVAQFGYRPPIAKENKIKEFIWESKYGGGNEPKQKLFISKKADLGNKVRQEADIEKTKALRAQITEKAGSDIDWDQPKSIVEYLDQYVVGQSDAKKIVAVAFSNYVAKIKIADNEMPKDNILFLGPSGVGKTYMISLLAKKAEFPMAQTKLTGKSSTGYVGENLSTVFEQFSAKTDSEAPYGVVFFDEIDKLSGQHNMTAKDVFDEKKQDELIGWLEDSTVTVGGRNARSLSTKNILFVAAGTFKGNGDGHALEEIIAKRIYGDKKRQIGFEPKSYANVVQEDTPNLLKRVRPNDLIKYGLKPELVGRLPAMAVLDSLTIDDKLRILREVRQSPLHKYFDLAFLKGFKISMEDGVHEVIVDACPEETGARALHSICNSLFTNIFFDLEKYADASNVIKVTPEIAKELIGSY